MATFNIFSTSADENDERQRQFWDEWIEHDRMNDKRKAAAQPLDFNKMNWKPILRWEDIGLSATRTPQGKDEIYIIAAGFPSVLVPYEAVEKSGALRAMYGERPDTMEMCMLIIDYCIKNAIFYHPIEEI